MLVKISWGSSHQLNGAGGARTKKSNISSSLVSSILRNVNLENFLKKVED